KPNLPERTLPIGMIGAGGIVNDAHLPAYQMAGFTVFGVTDIAREKSDATAKKFHIPEVFESVEQLVSSAPSECVFDIALPASAFAEVLEKLPDDAGVLIQKPMGDSFEQAKQILNIC